MRAPRKVVSSGAQIERLMIMTIGTVKWFNGQKGYGFITPDDGGKDIYVHMRVVEEAGLRGLAEGQKVTYQLVVDTSNGKTSASKIEATSAQMT